MIKGVLPKWGEYFKGATLKQKGSGEHLRGETLK